MISVLSHLKAARAAYMSTTGGRASMISTTPGRMRGWASGQKPQLQLIEEFHSHFWKAAAARSLKRDGAAKNIATAVLPMPSPRAVEKTSSRQDDHKARWAREDLYKHFHASAASRAMERHDLVMTKRRCPNEHAASIEKREGVEGVQLLHVEQLPSPIDVATSIKAREDMHHHFWSSRQAREDARNGSHARVAIHNSKHLHEHRCKLPKTLHAYFEAGSRMEDHHRPCPMAITETHPPFKIFDVNDDWTQLCGYTRQEAVGSTQASPRAGDRCRGRQGSRGLVAAATQ